MGKNYLFRQFHRSFTILCAVCLTVTAFPITAAASKETELAIAANQAIPVESNGIPNWPAGPTVSAKSAILMDLDTGVILYEKNIHSRE